MTTKFITTFKVQFLNSWWVVFIALVCFICYEQGVKHRNNQFQALSKHLQKTQQEKIDALKLNSELKTQIQSQHDTEWIELVLMRELGVVPDGYKKIYFNK